VRPFRNGIMPIISAVLRSRIQAERTENPSGKNVLSDDSAVDKQEKMRDHNGVQTSCLSVLVRSCDAHSLRYCAAARVLVVFGR
jgi:hypothetical protein